MTASVLVVDDDPGFRDLAERLLAAAGLEVVAHADSAAAAVSAARATKPDAALVDVGYAACLLRERPGGRRPT